MPIAFDDPLIAGMAIRRTRRGQAVLDALVGFGLPVRGKPRPVEYPGPLNTQVL
jgi:hypothetical protein